MTLTAGAKLGPYEILAPIGAGGMGEVYRARDTRLGREVAVKVLPASFSQDVDRLRRFEGEAKAASLLNHPNITAVYDVGSHDGSPYVVSELLEGETLRSRLAVGALSPRKATEYAVQIANGLAAAHEKGIVHRDLKPENLFVTDDGRVKILDFGLAKLIQPETSAAGQQTSAPTASLGTEPGVVMGTVGYMSPEQVKGQPADHRSDIFSFGAILYEMLSGRRAFKGDSAVETMSAILKEEPPDLSETNTNRSPGIERLVRHCLEKSPAQRFQSARDLAYDLESLSEMSGPSVGPSQALLAGTSRRRVVRSSAIVLAVVVSAAAGYLVGRRASPATAPTSVRVRRLSVARGFPLGARFAPDGKTIVYAASRAGENDEVFLTRTDGTESRALGVPNANVLAVSRNGEVAVGLRRSPVPQFRVRSTLASVALLGGAPRPLLDDVLEADWSPDGKQLAVVRWADGKEILEFPVGRPIETSDTSLMRPRVSPDGRSIAYFRRTLVGKTASLILSRAGEASKTLAENVETKGTVAWHPSGREIWFDLDEQGRTNICAASLDGRVRTVYPGLDWMFLDDIAPDGSVLLSRWTARSAIYFRGPRDAQERNLAWLDWGFSQDLSRDGSLLLFDESGVGGGAHPAVYVRPTDGSPAIRLGEGKALRLSPDGKSALALVGGKLVIYPTGAGQPREIPTGDVTPEYAAFFPDALRIRLNGFQPGRDRRNWVLDLRTGKMRPLTPEGPQQHPVISPDGRSIALTLMKEKRIYVYDVDGGTRREIPGTTEDDHSLAWSEDGKSLYVWNPDEIGPKHIHKIDIASGRRELWKEVMPADRNGVFGIWGLAMTPDASAYVYSAQRALSGDLFVVEGLK